jgi:hypothetical protein
MAMRWLLLSLSVVFVLVAVPAMAQSPPTNEIRIGGGFATTGELAPTSEMWFFQEQLRQYMDPKMSLRRIAEEKANQRRARLNALRWYGYSNIRPMVGMDPVHGDWGARWTSGNPYHPSRWSYFGPALVVVRANGQQRPY